MWCVDRRERGRDDAGELPLKRQMSRLPAFLSLVLFAALVIAWLHSYRTGYEIYRLADRRGQYVDVCCGRVTWYAAETAVTRRPAEWGYVRRDDTRAQREANEAIAANVAGRADAGGFSLLGFAYYVGPTPASPRHLTVHLWLPTLLFAVAPTLVLVRWVRRRGANGLCPVCDYDLRATPDRCPECGTVAEAS